METTIIVILVIVGISVAAAVFFVLFMFWVSSPSFNGATVIDKNISNQYYYKDKGVVYVSDGNFFSLGDRKIESADAESFQVLAYNLAKDKDHVYYNEKTLEHADPTSFEMLYFEELLEKKYRYYSYTKDASRVFYLFMPIKEADVPSYKYLWGNFSKDDKNLFYSENILAIISENPKQIKNDIKNNYLSMGQTVFYKNMVVEGSIADGFTVIDGAFAKDNNAVYFENDVLENVDRSSFEILNEYYQRDKNRIYYKTKPLFQSHPDSYEFINTLFSKDKNHLYYIGRIVKDANPQNYKKREIEKLENDRSLMNLIYDDNYTLFAKRNEIKETSRIHRIYNNEVYSMNTRVVGADYRNFKVFENAEEMYATDKNHVFYHCHTVKDADIVSFEAVNSKFAKDKNHVYFLERRLLDVNPATFVYQDGMYGETIDGEVDRLVYP